MRFDRSTSGVSFAGPRPLKVLALAIAWCVLAAAVLASSRVAMGATSANAQSALGINLTAMNYYNPEQPFLNIFKTLGITQSNPGAWSTRNGSMAETKEESYLQLDANGYPTSMKATSADTSQQFNRVCALILNGLPNSNAGTGVPYRSGQYVMLYDGQGSFWVGSDATLVSSSAGQLVLNVAKPSANGLWICITATDPNGTGNYVRNIRLVKSEEQSLLAAGQVFEPSFLSLMSRFKVLRAMQWLNIDDTPTPPGVWANRSHLTDAGWGSANGVPYEAIIQLCNATGADCWLNVPHTANNDFLTQLATMTHQMLNSSQKVYIEFSNEVWNGDYPQYQYAITQGQALWPGAKGSQFDFNRNWYGMRAAQTCDIWKSTWGPDAARVVCVLGAQAANPYTATESLSCPFWTGSGNAPCSGHNISAVAIAPYFGNFTPQTSWLSATDGGLASTFTALTADIATVSGWEAAYKTALAPYGLPFISYEGGQTLVGLSSGTAITNLDIAVNRDPRMAAAYTQALENWKSNGGELYTIYADIYGPSKYGEWGALESFLDTVSPLSSAPPKWQAIQNFLTANPCWWSECTGSTAAAPQAPLSIQVTN